jgi:hypothetical protein
MLESQKEHPGGKKKPLELTRTTRKPPTDFYKPTTSSLAPTGLVNLPLD